VVTAVAANLSGLDTLLAARPGSSEADLVSCLVSMTGASKCWVTPLPSAPMAIPMASNLT
jgi:hypothetical protein